MNAVDLSIRQFTADLAARQPTPGGGSTAAVGGALGAGLAAMAAAYTTGNEKFAAVGGRAETTRAELEKLRLRFLELVEEDIAAYGAYSAARALPKETPEQKAARKTALAAANEQATQVPEAILECAFKTLAHVEDLATFVNPALAGDVGASAYFLEAAVRSAAVQVLSNCAADKDGRNQQRRGLATEKVLGCRAARKRIDEAVMKMIFKPQAG